MSLDIVISIESSKTALAGINIGGEMTVFELSSLSMELPAHILRIKIDRIRDSRAYIFLIAFLLI